MSSFVLNDFLTIFSISYFSSVLPSLSILERVALIIQALGADDNDSHCSKAIRGAKEVPRSFEE
jgi:hypothetical protein